MTEAVSTHTKGDCEIENNQGLISLFSHFNKIFKNTDLYSLKQLSRKIQFSS